MIPKFSAGELIEDAFNIFGRISIPVIVQMSSPGKKRFINLSFLLYYHLFLLITNIKLNFIDLAISGMHQARI